MNFCIHFLFAFQNISKIVAKVATSGENFYKMEKKIHLDLFLQKIKNLKSFKYFQKALESFIAKILEIKNFWVQKPYKIILLRESAPNLSSIATDLSHILYIIVPKVSLLKVEVIYGLKYLKACLDQALIGNLFQ